ncbi:MAG: sigma-70 family RNA polymerase sigma factor [Clostridia bacterium]|nr:MAG: sigma-70 family RNA polymerase sigma factor [Clostridia bacterium]
MEEARVVAWFVTGLRHEALRLARKHRRLKERELLILNEQLKNEAGGEAIARMLSTVNPPPDLLTELENKLVLQEALALLTPLQQRVVVATVLEGVTEQELAGEMGVTKQAVNRIKERALDKLRKYFVLDKPPSK